jgi:hypothetical protein
MGTIFTFLGLEFLPNDVCEIDTFNSPFSKIEVVENYGKSSVYEIIPPFQIEEILSKYRRGGHLRTVFYPRYDGFDNLDAEPKECYGGIAVQTNSGRSELLSRSDFEVIARCLIRPA